MVLKTLSSEGKIAYLIKPILKVLQEAGGQLVYDAEADKYYCFHCSENFTSDQLFICGNCNRLRYRNGDAICTKCAEELMAKKD